VPSRAKLKGSQADVVLHEARTMLTPLARMLVAHGVTYPRLAQELKFVFLEAARAELAAEDLVPTDSALSLRSGVHRKDVRALAHAGARDRRGANRPLSFAAEVFTRWANDRRYADARGRPKPLPLRSDDSTSLSFEGLVRSVSKDFHPRSVLDELVRLGVAVTAGEQVRLKAEAFVPHEGFTEVAYYIGANVHDHLAAAAANLRTVGMQAKAPFLEHGVYADELSEESAVQLQGLARKLWSAAVKAMVKAALAAVEADRDKPAEQRAVRMRFGAFFYSEPTAPTRPASKRLQQRGSK